jgi:hypothetical protein
MPDDTVVRRGKEWLEKNQLSAVWWEVEEDDYSVLARVELAAGGKVACINLWNCNAGLEANTEVINVLIAELTVFRECYTEAWMRWYKRKENGDEKEAAD